MSFLKAKIEGTEEIKGQLSKLPSYLFPKVKKAFQDQIHELQEVMVGKASGTKLNRRTGELARGFQTKVGGTSLKNLFAEIVNNVKYAMIHEYGGIIRPVKAKWLTIPLPKNQTASGVMRKSARRLFSEGNAFIAKGVIFENRGKTKGGKDRKPVPMFALKKQVRIPARLGFRQAAGTAARKLYAKLRALF